MVNYSNVISMDVRNNIELVNKENRRFPWFQMPLHVQLQMKQKMLLKYGFVSNCFDYMFII